MALKDVVKRWTTPVDELDRADLQSYCDRLGLTPATEVVPREHTKVGGEVHSVRIVPRAGAPALEVTVSDGRGSLTAVFLGRRKIAGIVPGRKIVVEGMAAHNDHRMLVFNPVYTLLP